MRAVARWMTGTVAIAAAMLLTATATQAQAPASDSILLQRRAAQVQAMFTDSTVGVDTLFSTTFLSQVTSAQLRQLMTQLQRSFGPLRSVALRRMAAGPIVKGVFALGYTGGQVGVMTLMVDRAAPNMIEGLAINNRAATLEEVTRRLATLPGKTSFLAAELDGSRIVPLATTDTTTPLAIGSAFKLYILAELMREIEAGTRHWADVVRIDSASRSTPSGQLQDWPVGTPMTLQSIASQMISQSDNTAADLLLHTLGRAKVEQMLVLAGNAHAERSTPFLTTREMFVLKSASGAASRARFVAGSIAERRAVLTAADHVPYGEVSPDFSHGPVAIDSVEWFASAADLARVMVWIRDHSTSINGVVGRAILTINPGMRPAIADWKYIGFKGGSESGVVNLTYLLQRGDGKWFVLNATWNNSAKEVESAQFINLIGQAAEILGS